MKMSRAWAMPNSKTFSIKPIGEIIDRHAFGLIIDPFAKDSKIATVTNDIDPETTAEYHLDAIDFLRQLKTGTVDTVLFDPPYSPRQVSECYKRVGGVVNMQTTQASFWGNLKKEISRVVRPAGKVITCGWNSGGIGKTQGFNIIEILIVAHGGWHNDTIVTVERKAGAVNMLTGRLSAE